MLRVSPPHCRPLEPVFPKVFKFEGGQEPGEAAWDLPRTITFTLESHHSTAAPVSLHHTSTPPWVLAQRPRLHFQLMPAGPTGMFCSNRKWNPCTPPPTHLAHPHSVIVHWEPVHKHQCYLIMRRGIGRKSRISSEVWKEGNGRRRVLKRASRNRETRGGRRSVETGKKRDRGQESRGGGSKKRRETTLGEKRRHEGNRGRAHKERWSRGGVGGM